MSAAAGAPAARRRPAAASRRGGAPRAVRRWYLPLLAGTLPLLTGGFVAGALANRIVFVVCGLVAAAVYAALLRAGLTRGWSLARRTAVQLLALAAAAAAFAALVARHGDILDLGYRAALPALYSPVAARPATGLALAAALALAGVVAGAAPRAGRRRQERR